MSRMAAMRVGASTAPPATTREWLAGLRASGVERERTLEHLRALMVKAAAHQVHRLTYAEAPSPDEVEDLVQSAANDATVALLGKLDTFEGRSRFTTWAFKFGVLHAHATVRKAQWRHREVAFAEGFDGPAADTSAPDVQAEANDLGRAVQEGFARALTPHQRAVAAALLFDGVPLDVLVERTGSSRNALYKTLHEARKRLRAYLRERGYTLDRGEEPS